MGNTFFRKHKSLLKWITILAQLVLGGAAFCWVITWSEVDLYSIIQRLSIKSPLLIVFAILAFTGVTVLNALRYKLFFPVGIPFRYLIGITLFQNALLTFIPWRIGEISYPLLLSNDYRVPVSRSIAVILMIRLVDIMITVLILLVAGGQYFLSGDSLWITPVLSLVFMLPFLGSIVSFPKQNDVRKVLTNFFSVLQPLTELPKLLLLVLLSISIFVMMTVQSLWVLRAVALRIGFFEVALLNAVTLITAVLPVHPPGGWGTMDTIQVVLLKSLGYNPGSSLASILAAHSIYTIIIFIGGIVGWIMIRKNSHLRKDGSMS